MLSEFKDVSQHPGEPRRRYFLSDYFDLYVWEDKDKKFVGFQLCYDLSGSSSAMTRTTRNGPCHISTVYSSIGE